MHIMTIEICHLIFSGTLKPKTGHIISNKVLASSLVHDIQIQTAYYILVKAILFATFHFFLSVLGVKMAFPENTCLTLL